MPSSSRNAKVETRSSRSKLKASHEPYWTPIGKKLHLGYRKGTSGGSWLMRINIDGRYKKQKLGIADDFQESNGQTILTYFEAQDQARLISKHKLQQYQLGQPIHEPTISDIINNYLNWYKLNKKSYKTTTQTASAHILPHLGNIKANKLTTHQIRKWFENLANQPAKTRAKIKNESTIEQTPEALRKRKATANRILTVLKAALNHAWHEGKIASDEAWRRVKPFKNVDQPKIRFLTLAECTRLTNASDPDFRSLIRAALLTGCRYGELINLKASDFDKQSKTIHLIETKNGKPRHVPLTEEGQELLNELTTGKLGDDYVFTRHDGNPWGKSHQIRRMKDACERAKIIPGISFHVLRHTYGSLLASKGVPLQVIAELLGHSDTRITNRHYAHLMPSYVADTLRANLPIFQKNQPNKNIINL